MKKELKVKSLDYVISQTGNKLSVGCQSITKDDAIKIAEFINSLEWREELVEFTHKEARKVMKATGCKMRAVKNGAFEGED